MPKRLAVADLRQTGEIMQGYVYVYTRLPQQGLEQHEKRQLSAAGQITGARECVVTATR